MPDMEPTPQQVLACPMDPDENNPGASTVGEYLVLLLTELWKEGEGFSGKRPFGDGSWQHELYVPLVAAKLIEGELDEDGYIEQLDERAADKVIADAIAGLLTPITENWGPPAYAAG